MEFEIRESVEGAEVDAIIVGIPEGATSDPYFGAVANPLFASGDLPLRPLETIVVPGRPRTIFIGISKPGDAEDRKSTRLNSSHSQISYAVFCLKKKKKTQTHQNPAPKYEPLR